MSGSLSFHPVTAERWDDLLGLFGPNGAYSNCWCTWWILVSREFDAAAPTDRRELLHGLVHQGAEPGLLAYRGDEPVGWVAVGPRARYARMMSPRARVNGPLDRDDPGWVVNCFYLPRPQRGQGVASGLLDAAVDFAFERGASYVAGHPIEVRDGGPGAAALFVGTLSMFESAGFHVAEWRGSRPVVRIDRPASR
jgi:GNAT superfamily N-acetyltransferase